ncbi:hypothetical protein [Streptomyces sp. CB01201]|uniref:hypothetical protein n=1 Tax=Streptomyces sp. CB01201 TaxID=2020324 RepID=UPI001F24E3AA|nr:hypothetical protein [Streptomyces sp. CB01201]
MADLSAAVRALQSLVAEFPELPAGAVSVTDIWDDRLELALHNGLDAFEAWRAALGISPTAVVLRTQGAARTWCLHGEAAYAGATVRLVAYAPVQAGLLAHEEAASGVAA